MSTQGVPEHTDRIVLHVAGPDRPGITARLTGVIAEEKAELVDIGQSVLHGNLMLSAIVDIPESSNALRRLLFAANELGLRMDLAPFRPIRHEIDERHVTCLCVNVIGNLADGSATTAISRFMASRQLNIREIRCMSEGTLAGLELIAELVSPAPLAAAELAALRGELLGLSKQLGVDMAVQKDDIFRRNKRLVCLDVDSTFVKGECIDELAAMVGVKAEVAEITSRAMQGELDFRQALHERVGLLEGLDIARAYEVIEHIELSPGAELFVRTLKRIGYRVGLVSGGFDFFVDALRERFGLDFAFANELEVAGGKLTGRVAGTVVDPERKSQVLRDMAKVYDVSLEQTVAIGDGANDMLMLQTAGLGIAYRAKPKLQEVADVSLNHNEGMDSLLYLMGISAKEARDALPAALRPAAG